MSNVPEKIPNWIGGQEQPAISGEWLDKLDPHTGQLLTRAARSRAADIMAAVESAKHAFPAWSAMPAVQRGLFLHKIVMGMQNRQEEIAKIVAAETGKSYKDAWGETGASHPVRPVLRKRRTASLRPHDHLWHAQ